MYVCMDNGWMDGQRWLDRKHGWKNGPINGQME